MDNQERSSLEALADCLWAERHVVEYLLFKLVTAKLVLGAEERRFLTLALDEVDRVMATLRHAEQRREAALAQVARAYGIATSELTLSELATRTPEPMRSVFLDHQEGFRKLADQIDKTAAANRKLATGAINHVQQTLGALTGPPMATTYTAAGRADIGAPAGPTRLNWVL
jgi:soluble cytochrome b562